ELTPCAATVLKSRGAMPTLREPWELSWFLPANRKAVEAFRLRKWIIPFTGFTAIFIFLFAEVFKFFGFHFSNVDALLFLSSFDASLHFGSIKEWQTFAFGQGFGAFQHPTVLHIFWWIFHATASVQLAYMFAEVVSFVCFFWFSYLMLQR